MVAIVLAASSAVAACKSPTTGYERFTTVAPTTIPERRRLDGGTTTAAEVGVELSEWSIAVAQTSLRAGPTTFKIHNRGTMPHQFEMEGAGIEKRITPVAPDSSATLTLDLKAGSYEVYCPVGGGAHKKMGMSTRITVGAK